MQSAPNLERVKRFLKHRDYFRSRTKLECWKTRLSISALLLGLIWMVGSLLLQKEQKLHLDFTHGTIAGPHAAWASRCEACHASSSFSSDGLCSIFDVRERWHKFQCETCHRSAENDPKKIYAPHHRIADWKDIKNNDCGSCHHDHQGSDYSLVRMEDSACTRCHSKLEEHATSSPAYCWKEIKSFVDGSHGEFRPRDALEVGILLNDPNKNFRRTLRFDHDVHMAPGMNARWKTTNIKEEYRDRYKLEKDGFAQLSCASCHQLESEQTLETRKLTRTLPHDSVLPARASGAYMLPINYENHCQACHSLETGPVANPLTAILAPSVKLPHMVSSVKLPHRMKDDEIENYLSAHFVQSLAMSNEVKLPPFQTARDRLDPRQVEKKIETYSDLAKELVKQTKRHLRLQSPMGSWGSSCGKCHLFANERIGTSELNVARPNSPPIWYPHAKFDHSAHRAMKCGECHCTSPTKGPDPRYPDQNIQIELLNLPGIKICQQCHTPEYRREFGGRTEVIGGVRHKCVDCHRYHNGDFPLEGPGSPHRAPPANDGLDINGFLRGLRATSKREKQ